MTTAWVEVIIGIVTIVLSIGGSAFISGTRWGRVESSLKDLEADRVRHSDIEAIRERLAKIEGMFTLRLKGPAE